MSSAEVPTMSRLTRYYWRHSNKFTIAAIFLLLIFFLHGRISPSDSLSHVEIVKSDYDWSLWEPFHPIESLQPLPLAKPRKLPHIQHVSRSSKFDIAAQSNRREQVKQAMEKSWRSYKDFAWMHDELTPLTGSAKDPFGGWAASAVDSLDTLWIMGMKKEFNEAVRAIAKLDWAATTETACNMFETTIRHLGGLLSAYDLSNEPALLAKAIELGNMLYAGFDTPNHMPPFWFSPSLAKTGKLVPDDHQPSASAATLSMEFTRLAQLTGDNKYYDAVARVTDRLYENQNDTKLPGMWPTFFDLKNGVFTEDNAFSLGALSDSMYEYVLKMNLLLGATEPKYEQMYRIAADAIIKHLVFRPMTLANLDILFTGTFYAGHDVELSTEGQHLACFAGGMLAIGGKIFDIPEHLDVGARLTDGCIWAYRAFPTGLAPEIFNLVACDSVVGCDWDEQKWVDAVTKDGDGRKDLPKGFRNARDPRYILRPEALESIFVLYRITGREEYRDAAWEMFQSIRKATETHIGFAAIENVTTTGKPEQIDSMESFWMAETLKYLYLIFSSPDIISLDDYVLNTEAHPMKIPKG